MEILDLTFTERLIENVSLLCLDLVHFKITTSFYKLLVQLINLLGGQIFSVGSERKLQIMSIFFKMREISFNM